jgi:hypothetical protein
LTRQGTRLLVDSRKASSLNALLRKEVMLMTKTSQPACPNCNLPMEPVELSDVPADTLKSFLSISGNKLEDDWYWCSECDTYEQYATPKRLSPEVEKLNKMIELYSTF